MPKEFPRFTKIANDVHMLAHFDLDDDISVFPWVIFEKEGWYWIPIAHLFEEFCEKADG